MVIFQKIAHNLIKYLTLVNNNGILKIDPDKISHNNGYLEVDFMENESWRNVGIRIRFLRKENGLTLKQLAVGCGLSQNAISLVERGEVAPTILTLCKIAHALGVSASSLFQEFCSSEVILTRAVEGQNKPRPEIAFNALTKRCIQMPTYMGKGTGCSLPGRMNQMVLCISGTIEFMVDDSCYQLTPGDSLTFSAEAYHRWRNTGDETGVAVMVLSPQISTTGSGG